MGIWQIFQIANVIKMPVTSVHPMIGNPNVRADMHRTVYCIDDAHNQQRPIYLIVDTYASQWRMTMSFCPFSESMKNIRKISVSCAM